MPGCRAGKSSLKVQPRCHGLLGGFCPYQETPKERDRLHAEEGDGHLKVSQGALHHILQGVDLLLPRNVVIPQAHLWACSCNLARQISCQRAERTTQRTQRPHTGGIQPGTGRQRATRASILVKPSAHLDANLEDVLALHNAELRYAETDEGSDGSIHETGMWTTPRKATLRTWSANMLRTASLGFSR